MLMHKDQWFEWEHLVLCRDRPQQGGTVAGLGLSGELAAMRYLSLNKTRHK